MVRFGPQGTVQPEGTLHACAPGFTSLARMVKRRSSGYTAQVVEGVAAGHADRLLIDMTGSDQQTTIAAVPLSYFLQMHPAVHMELYIKHVQDIQTCLPAVRSSLQTLAKMKQSLAPLCSCPCQKADRDLKNLLRTRSKRSTKRCSLPHFRPTSYAGDASRHQCMKCRNTFENVGLIPLPAANAMGNR